MDLDNLRFVLIQFFPFFCERSLTKAMSNVIHYFSLLCTLTFLFIAVFFFFLNAIPVFCHTAFTVPFRSAVFPFQFLFAYPLLPSGGATGLRGTFPGHPRPLHLTFTDIHNTYTPMGAFSRRDSNPADLAVVSEECRSSFHHPTVSP
jgi:hypothetical protein